MNEEARSELAEWMRANLFWGLEPSRAPEAADAVLALPALQRLVEQAAEAARLRAERDEARAEWHRQRERADQFRYRLSRLLDGEAMDA